MLDWLKSLGLLVSLSAVSALGYGCASDGSSDDGPDDDVEDREEMDEDEAKVQAARDAWPEYTGDADELIDLSKYDTVTLIAFANLTDNSEEDDAGGEFVDELKDELEDEYPDAFVNVRIAEEPLGEAGEIVVRGQVYDFSSGDGWNPWTGRNKAKFKAEFAVEDGSTGEVLKSGQLKESGYEDNDELLEECAEDLAKTLARSKTRN